MNSPWPEVPTPGRGIWSHYTWFWKYAWKYRVLAIAHGVSTDNGLIALCAFIWTIGAVLRMAIAVAAN